MNKRTIIISIIVAACLISLPLIIFAYDYKFLQPLPGFNPGTGGLTLADYLGWLFKFMLAAAAFLAVAQIVIGGIQTIVGGASETQRSNAKTRIQDAIYGLLLALGSWLILWTINPDLASMKLNIPEVTIRTSAPAPVVGGQPLFDPGIEEQRSDASAPLNNLIDCMRGRLPSGVGRISSISDSNNRAGTAGFDRCRTCPAGTRVASCVHVCGSCHYGGGTEVNSYAVDFGDEQNVDAIRSAAENCGAGVIDEGDHIHVSINCPGGRH